MAPKRPATTSATDIKPKKVRKSLSLEIKLKIVKRHEGGEGANSIATSLGLAQSTVSTVIKKAPEVKKAGSTFTTLMAKTTTRTREPIMDEMERLLKLWIDDQSRRRMPLSTALVTNKALSLWEALQGKGYTVKEGTTFTASKGWFDRFRNRAALHNIKVTGEAASSDRPAADAFKPALKKRIEEGGFSAKQVINIDETGLYWKRMSSRTFIAKEEKTASGFKVSKDRLTLLLGGNAAEDLKLKPMLIYHSENPRALKGFIKEYLPVFWRSNKKAWMTTSLNQSYVVNYLSPRLRDYANANNIANRFLLTLDNAPSHPKSMEDWADNIEIMFMPPNTTALIQPMDQGVIATFKAYYQRHTMQQLLAATDSDNPDNPDNPTIKQFWSGYNIKKAIDNIKISWDMISEKTMNGCWKKLWPECLGFEGFDEADIGSVRKDIVRLSHLAGFKEVDEADVQELLESHDEPLSNEDLMQLEQERNLHDIDEDNEDEPVQVGLDIKSLREVFSSIEHALEILKERDPNPARSGTAAHGVEECLKIYKEMYAAKKKLAKQTTISSFFKPSSSAHATAGPSTTTTATNATAGPSTTADSTTATASQDFEFFFYVVNST